MKYNFQIISLASHLPWVPWETAVDIQLGHCTHWAVKKLSNSVHSIQNFWFIPQKPVYPPSPPHFSKWHCCSARCAGKTLDFSFFFFFFYEWRQDPLGSISELHSKSDHFSLTPKLPFLNWTMPQASSGAGFPTFLQRGLFATQQLVIESIHQMSFHCTKSSDGFSSQTEKWLSSSTLLSPC